MAESLQLTKREWGVSLLVIALALGNFFGVDLYIPSLPAIETSLGIGQSGAQLTVSIYMLGMAVSVFFCGPFSDRLGRKKVIVAGLLCNLVGSVVCFHALTGHELLSGRLIQGVGAGSCIAGFRAMVTDVFAAKKLSVVVSYLGAAVALSPIFAPAMGGYIQTYFGWRADFIALGAVYLGLLLATTFVCETNQHQHLHSLDVRKHLKNYGYLLMRPDFMTFAFCGGLALAVSVAYATSGPFIFQKILDLTPIQFGWLGIVIGGSTIAGRMLGLPLVKRFTMEKVMVVALAGIVLAGGVLGVTLGVHRVDLILVIGVVMLSFLGQGMASPNAFSLALSPYRAMGGTASALLTFMQMLLAFGVSYGLSRPVFEHQQLSALAGAYVIIGGTTLCVYGAFVLFHMRCGALHHRRS